MNYLYNKKRLINFEFLQRSNSVANKKKLNNFYFCLKTRQPNLFTNRIGCKLWTFFFSRVFKIRSKNTGVDNEGKNEADERDSRIHGFRVTVIYLLIFRRNSNVHNLKNVG